MLKGDGIDSFRVVATEWLPMADVSKSRAEFENYATISQKPRVISKKWMPIGRLRQICIRPLNRIRSRMICSHGTDVFVRVSDAQLSWHMQGRLLRQFPGWSERSDKNSRTSVRGSFWRELVSWAASARTSTAR